MNAAQAAQPPESRSQRPESGAQEPAAGTKKPETRGQKPEVENQKPMQGAQVSDDAGEDAEVATQSEPNRLPGINGATPPLSDDESYVWPEGSEAASEMSADIAAQNGAAPEAAIAPLPSLEELVKRIPSDVREAYEDLFRGKFVSAKRVSPSSLKS